MRIPRLPRDFRECPRNPGAGIALDIVSGSEILFGMPLRRVRHIMKQSGLLVSQRPVQRDAHPHTGTIVTDRVDYCLGEFVGTDASSGCSRWEALEPVRQGVTWHSGDIGRGVARGLTLRHDHGRRLPERDQILRYDQFARLPASARGNGVAERAIRTLKEQRLRVRHFATVEELRQTLAAFSERYNASWLRQRHGHKTPNQIRAWQKALETRAAIGVKMAA